MSLAFILLEVVELMTARLTAEGGGARHAPYSPLGGLRQGWHVHPDNN